MIVGGLKKILNICEHKNIECYWVIIIFNHRCAFYKIPLKYSFRENKKVSK